MGNGQTVLAVAAGMGAFKGNGSAACRAARHCQSQPSAWYPAFPRNRATNRAQHSSPCQVPARNRYRGKALGVARCAYHLNHRGRDWALHALPKPAFRAGSQMQESLSVRFRPGVGRSHGEPVQTGGVVVRVQHDLTKPCRKKQGDSCTYLISW